MTALLFIWEHLFSVRFPDRRRQRVKGKSAWLSNKASRPDPILSRRTHRAPVHNYTFNIAVFGLTDPIDGSIDVGGFAADGKGQNCLMAVALTRSVRLCHLFGDH